jgi:hypothetical protein
MAHAVNRMSQNVWTKAARITISLSSQDKIRRDKRGLCRKKRLITSHKRAGLRMDDDPVKALIDAMDDLDDFKPLLEALHTLQLV